jgi:hypothetical protein
MNATVILLDGERVRVTLPEPHWEGRCEISTGIIAKALYSGKRTGRHFLQSYSIWDNGRGGNTGEQFRELEEADYLKICEKVDAEPVYVQIINESGPGLLAALEWAVGQIEDDLDLDQQAALDAARAAIKGAV